MPSDRASDSESGSESALDCNLVFLLIRAGALGAANDTRVLAKHGLKVRQYAVLTTACTRPRTQKELSDFLMLNPSQIVTLVDTLEDLGLVEREAAVGDRRAKLVVATTRGRELFDVVRIDVGDAHDRLLGHLSPAQREEFLTVLRRLALPDS
ncbi:MarR family winged helix-turn-helix transcriptional regulator [Streptomyces sp. NPDC058442]|uniref:MarR family winged helix-turn-helix transcriptional regulator n=1 Tax=Streptomyces sp. NPDC058442 TaxID=3346503 RepID=UPI0036590833